MSNANDWGSTFIIIVLTLIIAMSCSPNFHELIMELVK